MTSDSTLHQNPCHCTNLVDKVPHGGLQLALWGSALHDFILNARIAIHVNSHFVINIDIYHH